MLVKDLAVETTKRYKEKFGKTDGVTFYALMVRVEKVIQEILVEKGYLDKTFIQSKLKTSVFKNLVRVTGREYQAKGVSLVVRKSVVKDEEQESLVFGNTLYTLNKVMFTDEFETLEDIIQLEEDLKLEKKIEEETNFIEFKKLLKDHNLSFESFDKMVELFRILPYYQKESLLANIKEKTDE